MTENVEGSRRRPRRTSQPRAEGRFVQIQVDMDTYNYLVGIHERTGVSLASIVRAGVNLMRDLETMAADGITVHAPEENVPGIPLRNIGPRILRTE